MGYDLKMRNAAVKVPSDGVMRKAAGKRERTCQVDVSHLRLKCECCG